MKRVLLAVVTGMTMAGPLSFSAHAAPVMSTEKAVDLQLWRLDCGTSRVDNLQQLSDTYNYAGQSRTLTSSCYLLRHNDELMLWDTGFPLKFLKAPLTEDQGVTLERSLTDQLAQINIKPDDIDKVAISHYHYDHVGQASQFPKATLVIAKDDLTALEQTPLPPYADRQALSPWLEGNSPIEPISGDYDVFGDGTVMMMDMPGHTAGSHALLVRLPESGSVLLSGDTVHFSEQLTNNNVPPFNVDRAKSLASMARLSGIADNLPATLIIQHEPRHINLLPTFPKSAR